MVLGWASLSDNPATSFWETEVRAPGRERSPGSGPCGGRRVPAPAELREPPRLRRCASGSDLPPRPPQLQPCDGLCVHVFLSHTCHRGTDFVLTLFWFMMLYSDYFTIIANVNKHLWDSRVFPRDPWTPRLCDTEAFLAAPQGHLRLTPRQPHYLPRGRLRAGRGHLTPREARSAAPLPWSLPLPDVAKLLNMEKVLQCFSSRPVGVQGRVRLPGPLPGSARSSWGTAGLPKLKIPKGPEMPARGPQPAHWSYCCSRAGASRVGS